ncbi:hypothetical protein [Achromobacter insolitus]|uniref:hypothetical protein n=1 Tax=Achromobacter insolitus TaxID=217204 RepID=UPI0031343ED9
MHRRSPLGGRLVDDLPAVGGRRGRRVTGGGYRGQVDFLLPVAGTLLALAVVCAVGAFFKRRG